MKDWTAAIIRDLVATSAFFLLFFPQLAGFFCFFILVEIFMHTEENYVPISGIFLKEVNPVSPNSPYCQTYDSYNIGLENLVKIP